MPNFNPGLEGVVIATTELSYIDGTEGRLLYRGYDIHDLVRATYEEIVYLLGEGDLPRIEQIERLRANLASERVLAGELVDFIRKIPLTALPMEALRTAVSALSFYDSEANDSSSGANRRKALRLTSKMASIVAALGRARQGKPYVEPDPDLSHWGNFLYMLFGKPAGETEVRALDVVQILHADHEMNASTFAARVTAATLSDMYSAVTSAIGTLKGPMHGGANEQVMHMLLEMGHEAESLGAIGGMLAAKKRIPGFGHRLYKTEDPRTVHLRELSAQLGERAGEMRWHRMSRAIEDYVGKERGLIPNVDFYSASCYYSLGIPVDLFTPMFAASRVAGWTAHVLEQYANNRLIRPEGEYVGPMSRPYVPLEARFAQNR